MCLSSVFLFTYLFIYLFIYLFFAHPGKYGVGWWSAWFWMVTQKQGLRVSFKVTTIVINVNITVIASITVVVVYIIIENSDNHSS